jgi:hypothetical protein
MYGRITRYGRRALLAATLVIAPAFAQSLSFESVITNGDLVGSASYDQSFRVVVLNQDTLATLSSLDGDEAVVYHERTGSSWTNAAVATFGQTTYGGGSVTFGEFSSLSLGGTTVAPRLTFVSESSIGFSLYQADPETPTQHVIFEPVGSQSLVTRSGLSSIRTAVNTSGDVLFGKVDGTTQSLQRGNGSTVTPLLTSGTEKFNETGSFTPTLPIKRVITSAGVAVGLATDTTTSQTAIYDFTNSSNAIRVAASTTEAGKTYRPRQVLGTNAANTLFVADVDSDVNVGRIIYQVGSGGPGNYRPLGTEFVIDGSKKPAGTMTANGNAAFYVPRTDVSLSFDDDSSIYFYEPTMTSPAELRKGDSVGDFTLDAIGVAGNETSPMVNDAGWVVFDASVSNTSFTEKDAYVAWNPSLNLKFVVAHVGGTIDIDGTTYTVTGFTALDHDPVDTDPFKDALGDDSRLALALTWEDDDANSYIGVVMVDLNTAVPEPGSVAIVLGMGFLAARRRCVGTAAVRGQLSKWHSPRTGPRRPSSPQAPI